MADFESHSADDAPPPAAAGAAVPASASEGAAFSRAQAGGPSAGGPSAASERTPRAAASARPEPPGTASAAQAGGAGADDEGDSAASLPLHTRLTAFETVLVAGGVLLFLALLYAMWDFLNPPLLGVAGLLLLWPLREHRTVRALMISGGFLLLLWFLSGLSAILAPFAVVYVLAYLFDPFVTYLQKQVRISRRLSSLLISLLVTGVFVLFVVLLVPRLVGQVEVLARRALEGVGTLRTWVETTPLLNGLESTGLLSRQQLLAQLNGLLEQQSGRLASGLPAVVQGLAQSLDSLLGAVTILAITPVILFYTLKDYRFITRRLVGLFPTLGGQRDYLMGASQIVGNYLRGQLLICAIAGFNVSLFLSPLIFDVPLWLLIGLIAGLMNLIPNLGAILTNIIAVTITVIFGDPWLLNTVAVVAVLMGQGLLEQSVLTPNIMSHQVGLHPVLVILSLLVFGYFMGIFGFLIAVPATALLMTIYKSYRHELTLDLSSYGTPPSPEMRRARAPSEEG